MFEKIVDQLEGNVHAVTLASRGEPTLNPNLAQMLDYAGNKFLGFKMNTNASMLTEKMCHTLLQSGLKTLVFQRMPQTKKPTRKLG